VDGLIEAFYGPIIRAGTLLLRAIRSPGLENCFLESEFSRRFATAKQLLPGKSKRKPFMTIARRIREVSKLSGDFLLRSGKRSNTYVDNIALSPIPYC